MNTLDITGQEVVRNQVAPKFVQLKAEMDKRRPFWDRMSFEQKKRWVQNAQQYDPLMWLAYQTWQYLDDWFDRENI